MFVRTIQPSDVHAAAEVETIAWGQNAAPPEVIARRASVFEPGSIVVLDGTTVVGYAAAQLTDHISTSSWDVQTDNGLIENTHRPNGKVAYGVSMSARPGVAGKGVAYHVIQHYAQLFLGHKGCSAMCVGSRVPGFAAWQSAHPNGTLRDFVTPMPDGRHRDPELRLYAQGGFSLLWELADYYPDEKSHGHGAMMVRTQL